MAHHPDSPSACSNDDGGHPAGFVFERAMRGAKARTKKLGHNCIVYGGRTKEDIEQDAATKAWQAAVASGAPQGGSGSSLAYKIARDELARCYQQAHRERCMAKSRCQPLQHLDSPMDQRDALRDGVADLSSLLTQEVRGLATGKFPELKDGFLTILRRRDFPDLLTTWICRVTVPPVAVKDIATELFSGSQVLAQAAVDFLHSLGLLPWGGTPPDGSPGHGPISNDTSNSGPTSDGPTASQADVNALLRAVIGLVEMHHPVLAMRLAYRASRMEKSDDYVAGPKSMGIRILIDKLEPNDNAGAPSRSLDDDVYLTVDDTEAELNPCYYMGVPIGNNPAPEESSFLFNYSLGRTYRADTTQAVQFGTRVFDTPDSLPRLPMFFANAKAKNLNEIEQASERGFSHDLQIRGSADGNIAISRTRRNILISDSGVANVERVSPSDRETLLKACLELLSELRPQVAVWLRERISRGRRNSWCSGEMRSYQEDCSSGTDSRLTGTETLPDSLALERD